MHPLNPGSGRRSVTAARPPTCETESKLENPLESPLAPQLDALAADLGMQRGGEALHHGPVLHCSTGFPSIDQLLGGGFPCGRLSEITGPPSSGRTSLALTLLAETTRGGGLAAVVDHADAFDPGSAASSGVDLDRVLWARAPAAQEALRCAERLLQTEGFSLVLLDLIQSRPQEIRSIQRAAWIRLARLAAGTRSALILLSQERLAGPQAEITLAMQPAQAHFTGTPPLLEELEARAVLVRHRAAPIDRAASVRLVESRAA